MEIGRGSVLTIGLYDSTIYFRNFISNGFFSVHSDAANNNINMRRLGRALNDGKGFSKISKLSERNGAYHLHFDFP